MTRSIHERGVAVLNSRFPVDNFYKWTRRFENVFYWVVVVNKYADVQRITT